MIEEVEIVDRDHPGGAAGGNQQRVHGVGELDGTGERVHRRPLEAVPRVVQRPHGDAGIDDAGAGNDVRAQAILPGTREERERVTRRQTPDQRRGELVDVLADAGALPERGPIVQQDAHVRSS